MKINFELFYKNISEIWRANAAIDATNFVSNIFYYKNKSNKKLKHKHHKHKYLK